MELKVNFYMWRVLSLMLFFTILSVAGCGGLSSVDSMMDAAENIMENRPDSALTVLNSIHDADLEGKGQRARYALLRSMALDKNYVDTTTFDVLQPAIEYYCENGIPDEKLRTYYYQGRIYQNRNDRDSALHSFMKALDISMDCKDSLTIARTLVMQGILYKSFYDYDGYTENYQCAAEIYGKKLYRWHEFDCLLNVLNGNIVLGRKEGADSIMSILTKFESLDSVQIQRLRNHRLTYGLKFGTTQDLKNLIKEESSSLHSDANGLMNLARAYGKVGDNGKAIQYLEYLDNVKAKYDTLKYLSIKYPILESLGKYGEALATYKDFGHRCELINASKFEQKSRSMEEKHRMELQAEMDAQRHAKVVWSFIGGISMLLLVLTVMVLMVRSRGIQKDLALQKARATDLENGNLKAEKENLALENRNLQLERDKKALEAENLAHRVKELEGESDGLKELLESQKEMPEEVRNAIRTRIEMLNSYLASQISDHKEFEKAYDDWVEGLTADKEKFMDSNRLAFQASHPAFIKYFEDHGLTTSEINYVCLYAIGLRGKDVGNYMKMRSHVNISSAIRRKLGIDKHETNIGIYVRKKLQEF